MAVVNLLYAVIDRRPTSLPIDIASCLWAQVSSASFTRFIMTIQPSCWSLWDVMVVGIRTGTERSTHAECI